MPGIYNHTILLYTGTGNALTGNFNREILVPFSYKRMKACMLVNFANQSERTADAYGVLVLKSNIPNMNNDMVLCANTINNSSTLEYEQYYEGGTTCRGTYNFKLLQIVNSNSPTNSIITETEPYDEFRVLLKLTFYSE